MSKGIVTIYLVELKVCATFVATNVATMNKNPKGIRYNEEIMNFVMEREKLTTVQKVVNFLLQDYWIKNKIVPTLNQVQNQIAAHTEAIKEPISQQPISLFDSYKAEILASKSKQQLQSTMNYMRKDISNHSQKQELERIANKHFNDNFFND